MILGDQPQFLDRIDLPVSFYATTGSRMPLFAPIKPKGPHLQLHPSEGAKSLSKLAEKTMQALTGKKEKKRRNI